MATEVSSKNPTAIYNKARKEIEDGKSASDYTSEDILAIFDNAYNIGLVTQTPQPTSRFKKTFDGMKLNICGNTWTIKVVPEDDSKMVINKCNGLCESWERAIYIADLSAVDDPKAYNNIELFVCKVLCHEIIHAVFFEMCQVDYYNDENLVDTLAFALPTLCNLFVRSGLFDIFLNGGLEPKTGTSEEV